MHGGYMHSEMLKEKYNNDNEAYLWQNYKCNIISRQAQREWNKWNLDELKVEGKIDQISQLKIGLSDITQHHSSQKY